MRWLTSLGVGTAALLAAAFFLNDYLIYLLSQIVLAAMVVLGLVLMAGIAGLNSFGQAAFVGLAAYTSAVATTRFGFSPWMSLPFAIAIPLVVALAAGAVTVRLSGHYLPLCTLAWALAIYNLFGNVDGLGRFEGIGGIPALSAFGYPVVGRGALILFGAVFLAMLVLAQNLMRSRTGRALRVLGDDRVMPECMGIDTTRLRLSIFLLAAAFAAVSGFFYAHLQRFISPSPFSLDVGLEYMFMALLGGSASLWGALVGAFGIIWAREYLKGILPAIVGRPGDFDIVVFAAGFILLMQRAPRGLTDWLGTRRGPAPPPEGSAGLPARERPVFGEPLLTASGIGKRFGGLVANEDVSLSLAAGEILAVIGPNGAGKSTLFNLLSGVLLADAGRVDFLGGSIGGRSAREIAARGLVRTFQHVKLSPDMSVMENIAVGAHRRGRSGMLGAMLRLNGGEERAMLAEAARCGRICGLSDRLADRAGSLPLGLQRIVEVARALAGDPVALMLDEPAAGLRAAEKDQLARLLTDLRRQGIGILLVEHDMDFVMGLADRIVVMNFGTVLASGEPAAIQANPEVLDAYLGISA